MATKETVAFELKLTANTKDAQKQLQSVQGELADIIKTAQESDVGEGFIDLVKYLKQINEQIQSLSKLDGFSFEKVFGTDATGVAKEISNALEGSMGVVDKFMKSISAAFGEDGFDSNMDKIRESASTIVDVYKQLGLEVPKTISRFKTWTKNSTDHAQAVKEAYGQLEDIDWNKILSLGQGSGTGTGFGGVSTEIENETNKISKEIDKLEKKINRYSQVLDSIKNSGKSIDIGGVTFSSAKEDLESAYEALSKARPTNINQYSSALEKAIDAVERFKAVAEKMGYSLDQCEEDLNGITDATRKYNAQLYNDIMSMQDSLQALYSQKYESTPGAIFGDFSTEFNKALDLDPATQKFENVMAHLQAIVSAGGEKISQSLAEDLQGVWDKLYDGETDGLQTELDAVIAKYQKTEEAAIEAGDKVEKTNEEIMRGLSAGGGDGTVAQEQYDALKKKLDETTESAKQLQEQLNESGGTTEDFSQLTTELENIKSRLESLQEESSTLASTSVSQELSFFDDNKLGEAEVEIEYLKRDLGELKNQLDAMTTSYENAASWGQQMRDSYYEASEAVQRQSMEIDLLKNKLEAANQALDVVSKSGSGLSEEQLQSILQILQDISSELQQIGESIRTVFTPSGGTTDIQQMTEKLSEFGAVSDTISQKIVEVENLGFYDNQNVLDSFKKSALETQPVVEGLIVDVEKLYNEKYKGNSSFDAMWAQLKNGVDQIQNAYQTIKDAPTTDWALMGADSLTYNLKSITSSMEGVSQEASVAGEQVAKMSLDVGPLTEVLNRLTEALEKVVTTFDQLKVNVTTTEFDAAKQKIYDLEQEVANLQDQLSTGLVNGDNINASVEKIGSLIDLDALKAQAKDANVFEKLTSDFQTLENVLHNKDLANETKVERAIELYETLRQKIRETAAEAADQKYFQSQYEAVSSLGNSLKNALSLSGDTKGLAALNSILESMKKNADSSNIKDYEKAVAALNSFDQIDLDFATKLKEYVDELERLSNLDLKKGIKLFDTKELSQFNNQIEKSKDLIGNSTGIEEYNTQVKALQELLNGLNRQVTAAFEIQDSGGYIPITASSVENLQRNREELAKYAETVHSLLTETGNTGYARTVVEVIKDINAATDPVQLQNYKNELKAIMSDAGVSTKGLSTVDKTSMDDIETRLENIAKVSQETGNIMGDMFSKVTTSGGFSFFKEQLELIEKDMSDGLGVQKLVDEFTQLQNLGVFTSEELKGFSDALSTLENSMGNMSTEQINAQIKGLQDSFKSLEEIATSRLQSSNINFDDFIPVDKLKGSVEELQNYIVVNFSNIDNLIDNSIQSKGSNAFQWVEKDAQGTLTQVTATFDKLGQVVVEKLDIGNIFNSSYTSSWLKTMKSDLTKTINDIISEMGKLMSMDAGSANYSAAEQRIQELLNKYQELANTLGSAADTQGFTDGLSKMFANFGIKVGQEIDNIQAKINSMWDSLDVGQEQSVYNQLMQLLSVFEQFNSADSIDGKLTAMKELQTLLPGLVSELDIYTKAQKEEAQATKEAAEAESVLKRSDTLSNNIQTWMKKNTAAAEQFKERLDEILKSLEGNSDPAVLKKATDEYRNIQSAAQNAGVAMNSFGKSLAQAALYAVGLGSTMQAFNKIVSSIKEAVSIVTELDSAMAQLQIVTGATESEMNQFLESSISLAKELGQSVTDVLGTIETFSRLGYNLEDASTLTEYASILSNVADVDIEDATTGLTSIVKAYGYAADDAEQIADILITVGQNYAISAEEIMTALEKSGSALSATDLSLEKSVALLAAANSSIQDASSVGVFCAHIKNGYIG